METGDGITASHAAARGRVWPTLTLVVATLVAYGPTYYAGFIWDDDVHVYANANLRSAVGLVNIWLEPRSSPQYYPLTHTTFWLEYQLWGHHPAGYHVVNVLLHLVSAVLVWRVLRWLSVPGAWVAAAVFALHPVHVESVAWITERKNTLSGVLYLASAFCFLKIALGLPRDPSTRHSARRCGMYAMSLVLYVGALLSKTVTATLPAALLLVLWWKKRRCTLRDLLAVLPMFLLGAPMGLFTAWLEKHHVMAQGAEWSQSPIERCLIAGRALWFYAGKLVCPSSLTFIYPRWQIDNSVVWQYIFPVAAVAVVGLLWCMRRRWTAGPLVGVVFFAGTLFPALGFFTVFPMRYSFVADHFQYLASIGLIAVLVSIGTTCLQRHLSEGLIRGGAGVLLGTLGLLSWFQCSIYQDAETLWRDTLAKNPSCEMAHTNMGWLLLGRGQVEEALVHFRVALKLAPDDATVLNNLAGVLIQVGDYAGAGQCLQKALTLEPEHGRALANLGLLYFRQEELTRAKYVFERAVERIPSNAPVRFNYGLLLQSLEEYQAAKDEFEYAIALNPDFVAARFFLAKLLLSEGACEECIGHLECALRVDPSFPAARELLEEALRDVHRMPDKSD